MIEKRKQADSKYDLTCNFISLVIVNFADVGCLSYLDVNFLNYSAVVEM